MTFSKIQGVRIAGIAGAIPKETQGLRELSQQFELSLIEKTIAAIGVNTRHVANASQCTSDFCSKAASKLLNELNWLPESIDILIFVTQTPDYIIPATSFILHQQLGLSKNCAVFDINLGCSGYVYGLWQITSLLSTSNASRALLLVGDTITRLVSSQDQSTVPLFGDAGTATALEKTNNSSMYFVLGSDGSGYQDLRIPAGGMRTPHSNLTNEIKTGIDGHLRSDENLFMNGAEIFSFTLREIPLVFKQILEFSEWDESSIDAYVFHQANLYMLNHLVKRLKIPADKFILALKDIGNTSSASIPLAIINQFSEKNIIKLSRFILVGFGVGFSWAAAALTLDNTTIICNIDEI